MNGGMHLWDVEHSYYCNEGNYFTADSVESYFKSLADFLQEWNESDMDMNLLFRWDWKEEDSAGNQNFNGDLNYRNGKLYLFWMGQRKGLYQYSIIEVCRADETAVIAFLEPRWRHMHRLWEPLSVSPRE